MGWATNHIVQLKEGKTVQFRPKGNSMRGKIESGQLVEVRPVSNEDEIKKGDIVLCKVRGTQYLHLVKAIKGNQFLIGNNRGGTNGWIPRTQIFGLFTRTLD